LAIEFSRKGFRVVAVDTDAQKVQKLLAGEAYLKHISIESIRDAVVEGRFLPTSDVRELASVEAVVICVPTPLTKHREPDLSYVIRSGEAVAAQLQPGMLVVLESTTYPGTTDEALREVLEAGSGLKAGQDFALAFAAERVDPGNERFTFAEIPKVIGGLTPKCLERVTALYRPLIDHLVPVSTCRAAEATKLLENIFRSVNIALVNELKVIYGAMGIDIWEVIAAAKTKPFGFMPFYPGPGLGGHCIPIDPFYLTWKAREFGHHTRFIELAGEINRAMPQHVVRAVAEALNSDCKALKGAKVLVVGLAYKPDIDDIRESPSFAVMDLLAAQGAHVSYYDPHVPIIPPTREHLHWSGAASLAWNEAEIAACDAAVVLTAHRAVDFAQLSQWSRHIIDTRNALASFPPALAQIHKA
jgi:UDP-N-acetyl-D-glucosamine dehydrogenase